MTYPIATALAGASAPGRLLRLAARAAVAGFAAAVLAGCAATGTVPADAQPAPADVVAAPPPAAAGGAEFDQDTLYRLLVGEMAGRRGRLDLAVSNYIEVARETRDPAVAERAVRIAVFARDEAGGLEAARLWTEIQPERLEASQVYAALLLRAGRLDEATVRLAALIEALEARQAGRGFAGVSDMLARERDEVAAASVMRRLVAGHEDNADAQLALANLLARAGFVEEALPVYERVVRLAPDDPRAAVFHARTLQRLERMPAALEHLESFLERLPDSQTVRMTLARMLVDARRYEEARANFEQLAEEAPDNADVRYALGLLLVQTNRLDQASEEFLKLVHSGQRRESAWYYLGQIAETQERLDDAVSAYRRVDRGEHRLNAQIRVAVLTAELGDVRRARAHLHALRGNNTREAVRIYRAEAEILTRRKLYPDAMTVYDAALGEYPRDTDLLYARAMLAEKMDRIDVVERDLRDILSREPNNADALNALGYTLADRTERYEEALELIKRAYELKPGDHYIVDSMGWIMYRLGRHQEAIRHLRRAMELRPDPEIAAHLGEVLWVTGDRAGAREVWDAALESTPDDQRILDVKKRFGL